MNISFTHRQYRMPSPLVRVHSPEGGGSRLHHTSKYFPHVSFLEYKGFAAFFVGGSTP